MQYAITNVKIVTPFRIVEHGAIVIDGKAISELGKMEDVTIRADVPSYDFSGMTVTPGFVDLLVHGGGGAGFSDNNDESTRIASEFFFKHGTTGMLASLFSKPTDQLLETVSRLADYAANTAETNIWGIHMEGPFINPEMKGVHKVEYLWKPSVEAWKRLNEAAKGYIKIMTIAPEVPGNLDVIRAAAISGVVPSIGHSLALYEDIEKAIDNGAAHVTHMFNAMRPFHHREAGIMVSAMLRHELKVELIADTIHVNPQVMKLLFNIKGNGGIILVTDSLRATGMPDGDYDFMDQHIIVKEKRAYLPNGTLAGSTLTMEQAVKNMVLEVGVPLCDAVRMASLNGAKVLAKEHRKGILAVGKDADLVIMDDEFEVQATICEGIVKYQKEHYMTHGENR